MPLPEATLAIAALITFQNAPIVTDIDAIALPGKAGVYYVPLRHTATSLSVSVEYLDETSQILLAGAELESDLVHRLPNGTAFVPARVFESESILVEYDPETEIASMVNGKWQVNLTIGEKYVEISLADQRLRAWQGSYIVFETNVSTGRYRGSTPTGTWPAGPIKRRMHYSSLYNNAPMPYSIQITGNIFMHGYTSVPRHPASNGCIRIPLTGINPARWLFNWVSLGTPVRISQTWSYDPRTVAEY